MHNKSKKIKNRIGFPGPVFCVNKCNKRGKKIKDLVKNADMREYGIKMKGN
jgi:hypothetical protein